VIALDRTAHPRLAPTPVEAAILRTILYADVFDYPLTTAEIHRYLSSEAETLGSVQAALAASDWLGGRLSRLGDLYTLTGREALADLRAARAEASARSWPRARRCGRLLAHLPFVRMAAVTGALAMNNVPDGDDVDLILVTAPGRVWLARAFAIAVVRAAKLFNMTLCPNYLLAETRLQQDQRDLFVAHELAQMIPLAGSDVYWRMRAANGWAANFLPNAGSMPGSEGDGMPHYFGKALQRFIEWLLSGRLGDWLEGWERRRKIAKFRLQLDRPDSEAVLDETQVKGHFNNYRQKVMQAYEERCRRFNLPA
jgi:hypothetical protein